MELKEVVCICGKYIAYTIDRYRRKEGRRNKKKAGTRKVGYRPLHEVLQIALSSALEDWWLPTPDSHPYPDRRNRIREVRGSLVSADACGKLEKGNGKYR